MSLETTSAPVVPVLESEQDILATAKKSGARRKRNVWLLRLAILVVWLGSWELAGRYWIDPFFYSMPSKIWERLVEWFTVGTDFGSIWYQILVTVEEAVIGFVLGAIAGVLCGVVLGRSRYLAEVLAPFIKAANALPRIVLAALFVIWFGLGLSSKIATVFILVFFAVFFNAFTGAREVDRNLIDNARILGASRWAVLRSIVLPSATSWILSSLHVAFGFALIGAVVGEYTGAKAGMGFLIANAQGTFDTAGVYGGMLIVTVVALFAEWLISTAESRLLRWRPQMTAQAGAVI
ncbi:ABC transporter permease [Amycolatopsis sp. FDAARGOS 1241]|uniref:ABC transporter permease n=1 Tax=Amycolatopsis sp. FDAARGOS 1241 TaxID=2778070 RepID=UPI0019516037|nr:ABC transporter permease [Amycolatopsis sp. FDAARGOS 1241]QRP45808.1 ABC transporter permease [Amycolatopsis sp. FDAARGOS 1241]